MAKAFYPVPSFSGKAKRNTNLRVWRNKVKVMNNKLLQSGRRLWAGCVGAYLDAMSDVLTNHQETGQTLASLIPLANAVSNNQKVKVRKDFVRMIEGKIRPRVIVASSGSTKNADFADWASMPRSVPTGEVLGLRAYKVGWGTLNRAVFTLSFRIVTFQHYLHETGIKGMWGSMEAGEAALKIYWDTNFDKYMNIDRRLLDLFTE